MKALSFLKVVDFSWAVAGPMVTKYLADYGATVVRIESSNRPCILRLAPPFKDGKPGLDRSGYWPLFNANKYSLSLELGHERAGEVLRRLVTWADVVCESFSPGTLERLCLSYDEMRRMNPGVVLFRTSIHGQTGRRSRHPGAGVQMVGLAGFTEITGWPDRPPVQPYGAYTDLVAPIFGASALLAAVNHRQRTGEGQCLDLSQVEASVQFIAPLIAAASVNPPESYRQGNASRCASPHGCFRCRGDDCWCAVAVFDDRQWAALGEVLGSPDWACDGRFETLPGRKRNEHELEKLVEARAVDFDAAELMMALQRAGVPAGVVKKPQDVYNDPGLSKRGTFWRLKHREIGWLSHLGQPAGLSATPAVGERPGACIGEHTEMVCRDFLRMSKEEFNDLAASGVFGLTGGNDGTAG